MGGGPPTRLDRQHVPFMSSPSGPGLGGAPAASANLPYADRVVFTYEPASGLYLRVNRGRPHTDADGRPFGAAVVVTIAVPVTILDKVGRLRLDFGAADPAVVFQAGITCLRKLGGDRRPGRSGPRHGGQPFASGRRDALVRPGLFLGQGPTRGRNGGQANCPAGQGGMTARGLPVSSSGMH